ncbi:Putative ABC iron siderophore transporter [Sandaracinus amylolyticus]|uniref:Putative ABC iron siderophore transporter n=1 Tax=Sandaracinus amylolyticus TaxID=927083 RepID=A0A0F6SDZ7_9BACT|nr:Putative ABC iron siderophore transporter [Sandaracinus amylolyticus]
MQTSSMDCGPAALKCLLEGFGVHVGYGRLREACHTDVDGTSIDTLEDVARALGLDAEQLLVPYDHVLAPESGSLPAIVIVRLPSGFTHFVVIYRRHGPFVQVMDPATGRRWTTVALLQRDLYQHRMAVPAAAFREYAVSKEMSAVLDRRMASIGIESAERAALWATAIADPGPWGIAALDAAVRVVAALATAGELERGSASTIVAALARRAAEHPNVIPERMWTAHLCPADDADEPHVMMRGAVVLRAKGLIAKTEGDALDTPDAAESEVLRRALDEARPAALRELVRVLAKDGVVAPIACTIAIAMAAIGALVEALLLRGMLDLGVMLPLREQRIAAVLAMIALLATTMALELPQTAMVQTLGRRLEARLRVALQTKIPRLPDRFFQSRLTSDMAQRSHSLSSLQALPRLGGSLLASFFGLIATVTGLVWLDPAGAPIAIESAVLAIVLPLVFVPVLSERELRVQTHLGAIARYYLDALLGITAVRAHSAERAVRREHESLLVEWQRSARAMSSAAVRVDTLVALAGAALAIVSIAGYLARGGALGGSLLVAYWALAIPMLGEQVALSARLYPHVRGTFLRLLEPLDAPEDPVPDVVASGAAQDAVALRFDAVEVRAGGHRVLHDVELTIAAGEHVAIVGQSGAGKSSLLATLLGFYTPIHGEVRVDGAPLDPARLASLRRELAWIDPAVQLWNRSLLANLRYGADDPAIAPGRVLDEAHLLPILERLPDGLATPLGEGGALLSGGEGQRVRAARAFLRSNVRLALLDEPFRGLDRDARRTLTERARHIFREATLLAVTHDVRDTSSFDRVVVIEDGQVIEDGAPAELLAAEGSRYRALFDADVALADRLWGEGVFRRIHVSCGALREERAQ